MKVRVKVVKVVSSVRWLRAHNSSLDTLAINVYLIIIKEELSKFIIACIWLVLILKTKSVASRTSSMQPFESVKGPWDVTITLSNKLSNKKCDQWCHRTMQKIFRTKFSVKNINLLNIKGVKNFMSSFFLMGSAYSPLDFVKKDLLSSIIWGHFWEDNPR